MNSIRINSTLCSQEVSHPSTDRAQHWLTSVRAEVAINVFFINPFLYNPIDVLRFPGLILFSPSNCERRIDNTARAELEPG